MVQPKITEAQNSYDIESRVESFHWWFSVRRKLLSSILSSIIKKLPNRVALEVGCGTGANLKVLGSIGFLGIGLDKSLYPLNLIKKKNNYPLFQGDLIHLPIKTNSVGLIIAMDVFEHLDQDEKGIRECHRVLSNEGILFLTVPAFKSLWGVQDEVTGHKRRYTMKEIKNILSQEGFDILRSSYFNFFLFFPILIVRRIINLLRLPIKSENEINNPMINSVLKAIFSLEPYFLKYVSFPFGVSIFCVARKRC